jgi:hypothetical protein
MQTSIRWLAIVAALGPVTAFGQAPPRRAHHTVFYDEARQRVMLTGGSTPVNGGNSFQFFNDLWAFDGKSWQALTPSGALLSGVAVAADDKGRIVSFGGYARSSIGDLRVLENDTWRAIGRHPSIVAAEPGFVFDAARKRFLAFGGSGGRGTVHGDVWELVDTTWTRSGATPPPARQAHAMVYDAKRQKTVVFGGMTLTPGSPPVTLGDTWEFDGSAWKQIQVDGPLPRMSPGVAYDSKRGLVLVFGGSNQSGFLGDLWAWDGATWKKLADSGPEPRGMGYMAYDAKRDRVVLFGGRKGYPDGDLNDTWEWDGSRWSRVGG